MKTQIKKILGIGSFLVMAMALATPVFAETLTRQLDFGMSGDDVSTLQTLLSQDPSIYPEGLVTGYFGSLTKAAVMNFQARNGIDQVGRVGPITLSAINAQMNNGYVIGIDRTAPMISGINIVLSSTTGSATINWTTNEAASGLLYYSVNPINLSEGNLNSSLTATGINVLANTDLKISHRAVISGLQAKTTYFYVIYAKDGSGNENVTWPAVFLSK